MYARRRKKGSESPLAASTLFNLSLDFSESCKALIPHLKLCHWQVVQIQTKTDEVDIQVWLNDDGLGWFWIGNQTESNSRQNHWFASMWVSHPYFGSTLSYIVLNIPIREFMYADFHELTYQVLSLRQVESKFGRRLNKYCQCGCCMRRAEALFHNWND